MIFHITPCILRAERCAMPELIDVHIPELQIQLHAGKELRFGQAGINPQILTACRNADAPMQSGFLIQTNARLSKITVITRFQLHLLHGGHISTHTAIHPLLEHQFDCVSCDPHLWAPTPDQRFGSRWPGYWGDAMVLTPGMNIRQDKSPAYHIDSIQDTLHDDIVIARTETLALPSIEPGRLFGGYLKGVPCINDAFLHHAG